jgi:hypothetical protein
MTTHAEGTFTVASWDEDTFEELGGGAKLTRARIVQEFTGDLEATGAAELLMCYAADGTATIVGLQRFLGRLGDRKGGFVLQSVGSYDGKEAKSTLTVVPGSGTDGLAGLRGEGTSAVGSEPPGSFTLDYELD